MDAGGATLTDLSAPVILMRLVPLAGIARTPDAGWTTPALDRVIHDIGRDHGPERLILDHHEKNLPLRSDGQAAHDTLHRAFPSRHTVWLGQSFLQGASAHQLRPILVERKEPPDSLTTRKRPSAPPLRVMESIFATAKEPRGSAVLGS